MKEAALPETLLTRLGYAVFEDAGAGELSLIGPAPEWFHRAFGDEAARTGRFVPGDSSPFLENFLNEAQRVWEESRSGDGERRAESGDWVERGADGEDIALEAEAFVLAGRRMLLVANLQARFDEKTRMLQIARVDRLAHDQLRREIQTKEILLHCIVHDLSQPLTALKGCLALLTMNLPPDKLHEVVDIAERQTRKQEEMIRDVLKAFSSEMAAAAGAKQSADAAQVAREVVAEYSAAFASQGARLALDARLESARGGVQDWSVVGEADRLRRMFTNYLENALRYSPSGTVVTVGIEEESGFLRAFVDDQGPGLPEGANAGTLFRLFGKGKESKGKAGLGLYFCKITAERWGGGVGCENRAGGGTRFWFRLPRAHGSDAGAQAGAGEPAAARGTRVTDQSESQAARPLRILLADDVDVNRTIAEQLLKGHGHVVKSVDDGRPAVEAFRSEPYDVVLLDVEMAEMGGLAAARAMRQIEEERGTHARILAMTGHRTQQDLDDCLAAGMDGRVLKPFDVEAFYREVEQPSAAPHATEPAFATGAEGFQAQLLARCSGDMALAAKIAKMFLKDSPRLLDAVQQAIANGDAGGLASAAHALKGAVGHFGAQEAREAARRLEDAARRGEMDGVDKGFETLAAAVDSLRAELEKLAEAKPARRASARRN
jgi:signal transduction histidine kinase/HPt (histidine-containing phosphotransfer) domain-containing protein